MSCHVMSRHFTSGRELKVFGLSIVVSKGRLCDKYHLVEAHPATQSRVHGLLCEEAEWGLRLLVSSSSPTALGLALVKRLLNGEKE